MDTITSKDGTSIYFKDCGRGPVVTFSHGWPLSADAWDGQMLFLAQHGFRTIAHDRRGHGRSGQASSGNDMNGYADDLACVIEALDLRNVTLVGHATGGGEVVRYIGRHGTQRVTKVVLIAAAPPTMEVFDSIRAGLLQDRSQLYRDLAVLFYGANRPGAQVTPGLLDQFWLWSMQSGLKNAYDSIKAFFETDFTEDLRKIDVPVLILQGEETFCTRHSASTSSPAMAPGCSISGMCARHWLGALPKPGISAGSSWESSSRPPRSLPFSLFRS